MTKQEYLLYLNDAKSVKKAILAYKNELYTVDEVESFKAEDYRYVNTKTYKGYQFFVGEENQIVMVKALVEEDKTYSYSVVRVEKLTEEEYLLMKEADYTVFDVLFQVLRYVLLSLFVFLSLGSIAIFIDSLASIKSISALGNILPIVGMALAPSMIGIYLLLKPRKK